MKVNAKNNEWCHFRRMMRFECPRWTYLSNSVHSILPGALRLFEYQEISVVVIALEFFVCFFLSISLWHTIVYLHQMEICEKKNNPNTHILYQSCDIFWFESLLHEWKSHTAHCRTGWSVMKIKDISDTTIDRWKNASRWGSDSQGSQDTYHRDTIGI